MYFGKESMIDMAEEVCDEEVEEILAYAPGIPESKEAFTEYQREFKKEGE